MQQSIKAASEWQDKEILGQEANLTATFQKAGMTVIEPDVESFRKPVLATAAAEVRSQMGQGPLGPHRRDVTHAPATRRSHGACSSAFPP